MQTELELMRLHVRALFTHDAQSMIQFVNEPDGAVAAAPRMFLGRSRSGNIWRFRADLSIGIISELDRLCADEAPLSSDLSELPRHVDRYRQLLGEELETGPAYYFSKATTPGRHSIALTERDAEKLKGGFEEVISELPRWQPFVAILKDDRAVSVCRSVRITAEAHEAGVETLPDFRGEGYAMQVTADWAERVRALGAIPLYSTSWTNIASQAVARKLGLECYGVDFQVL